MIWIIELAITKRDKFICYIESITPIYCVVIYELLYIRTNEVKENINSIYITCKNNIEQSRGERRHISNRFVYFLFIQLNGIFSIFKEGPSWSSSYGSCIYNYLCNQCLSPLMLWIRISIRARCATLSDKVCQWLATGRWFYLGPPVSYANYM